MPEKLEEELMRALSFNGMDKNNLLELVKIVVKITHNGAIPHRVFTKGTPVLDALELQALLDRSKLNLLTEILDAPRFAGLSVFPYGIPKPEFFQLNVRLGEAAEANTLAVRSTAA